MKSGRTVNLLEAILVTFLWSSSFLFIKVGLEEIPPMTFAAYRYSLASVILLAYALCRYRDHIHSLGPSMIFKYVVLGFFGYFIAQGLQFFGLYYLPTITVTFLLNMTPLFVLLFSIIALGEKPEKEQLLGIVVALLGVMAFFSGKELMLGQRTGIGLTLTSGI